MAAPTRLLRAGSQNLNPVPFWGVGAQVCALNWQTFDASMQLNEALFASTNGWVLKPPSLRKEAAPKPKGKVQLTLEIAGATDLAVPEGRSKDIKCVCSRRQCRSLCPADAACQAVRDLHTLPPRPEG